MLAYNRWLSSGPQRNALKVGIIANNRKTRLKVGIKGAVLICQSFPRRAASGLWFELGSKLFPLQELCRLMIALKCSGDSSVENKSY
jgi:hypothetical protein